MSETTPVILLSVWLVCGLRLAIWLHRRAMRPLLDLERYWRAEHDARHAERWERDHWLEEQGP
mgnify:CR=1 FL=1